ncbi:Omega-6 fatty acid desaturase, endoplasmic reticulum [Capsicum annuum]|uniref:delta(12)-fatty-acid desaturase FAD2 n=1 Tax=Capsicum annuum TaxID=4072 RepID=UPI0007BEB0C8|nr:delta(12)-fatty-acid desaturase FAD2 [Capsicum annuum]KAF3642626.1 Omega-6 fatty acid desaturase, endoplasmic reticulum [Capsicum annuum]
MSGAMTKTDQRRRAPVSKAPFTVGELKKAIPPHCFQRSLVRSFYYVVKDITLLYVFSYIANTYFHLLPYPYYYLAWPIYWIAQGSVLTGIWVIAHECTHHGFSNYQWVDDTVGFILYTIIFVPYFSWKYSHRRHHSNAGSLEYDEVYVPRLKSELRWFSKYLNNLPGRVYAFITTLNVGWQSYLSFNASGRQYDKFTSHYNPYSPMYNDRERLAVYISDLGLLAFAYVLYRIALAQGLVWLVCMYGVPLQVQNMLVVLLTLLNHTHASVPHYDSSEWDWIRGALCTVDRDFGVLNLFFHDVTNTHVLHHLFTTIPHYHAVEATKAVKPLLGEYYQFDGTPFYKAIWRDLNDCIYVEKLEEYKDRGIFWYNNKL